MLGGVIESEPCIWCCLCFRQESNNMVVPAMQLASKIPDMSVQLWSSALLKGKSTAVCVSVFETY